MDSDDEYANIVITVGDTDDRSGRRTRRPSMAGQGNDGGNLRVPTSSGALTPTSPKIRRGTLPKQEPVLPPMPVWNSAAQFGIPLFDFALGESTGDPLLDWLSQFCILSQEKREQYTKVFEFFDTDHDNSLTAHEVRSFCPTLISLCQFP